MRYLAIISILLILIACGAPERVDIPETKQEVKIEEKVVQDIAPPAELPAVQTPEPAKQEENKKLKSSEMLKKSVVESISTDTHEEEINAPPQGRTKLYDYLDKFAQEVSGYSFDYKSNNYFVRGTKYKIILGNPVSVRDVIFGEEKRSLFYYDTIYIDRSANSALAYCEGHTSSINRQCDSLDLYDLALPLPADSYAVKLPEDWLFEYLKQEPIQVERNKNYIKQRIASLVRFSSDGNIIDLNIDELIGLPIRVDIKVGDVLVQRYDYENVISNKVRDVDVIHRSKSEIPTSEVFYR